MMKLSNFMVWAILGLTLVGCSKSSEKDKSVTLEGSTSGLVTNAAVSVFRVVDSVLNSEADVATESDDNGEFSVNMKSSPDVAYVEVRGKSDGSTWVQCTAESCGEFASDTSHDLNDNGLIDFGEWFEVGDEFVISAWVTNWQPGTPISVNTMTMAVSQQFDQVPTANEVNEVYDLIQTTFGLSERVDKLTVLDVTSPDISEEALADALLVGNTILLYGDLDEFSSAMAEMAKTASDSPLADMSPAQLTAHALRTLEGLDSATAIRVQQSMKAQNLLYAEEEGVLMASDIPMLPPLQ